MDVIVSTRSSTPCSSTVPVTGIGHRGLHGVPGHHRARARLQPQRRPALTAGGQPRSGSQRNRESTSLFRPRPRRVLRPRRSTVRSPPSRRLARRRASQLLRRRHEPVRSEPASSQRDRPRRADARRSLHPARRRARSPSCFRFATTARLGGRGGRVQQRHPRDRRWQRPASTNKSPRRRSSASACAPAPRRRVRAGTFRCRRRRCSFPARPSGGGLCARRVPLARRRSGSRRAPRSGSSSRPGCGTSCA